MACHVCGRSDVKKRPRSGKLHYPHKCPHGVWCVTGHRLLGSHANQVPVAGPNRCEACAQRALAERQARWAAEGEGMTPAKIADAINFPLAKWPGQCSGVAHACLQAKVVRGRLCYGHYVGPIAKTGPFAGRPFSHHAWIELRDGRIWDPTRWVFEDVAPYIYIGPNDHYDFGGNAVNEAFRSPYPATDWVHEKPEALKLNADVRKAIGALIGQPDWDGTATPRQIHWLGNINIMKLEPQVCSMLFREIIRLGYGAHIPIDNRRRILG